MKYLKNKKYTDAKDFAGECESVVIIAKGQSMNYAFGFILYFFFFGETVFFCIFFTNWGCLEKQVLYSLRVRFSAFDTRDKMRHDSTRTLLLHV